MSRSWLENNFFKNFSEGTGTGKLAGSREVEPAACCRQRRTMENELDEWDKWINARHERECFVVDSTFNDHLTQKVNSLGLSFFVVVCFLLLNEPTLVRPLSLSVLDRHGALLIEVNQQRSFVVPQGFCEWCLREQSISILYTVSLCRMSTVCWSWIDLKIQ